MISKIAQREKRRRKGTISPAHRSGREYKSSCNIEFLYLHKKRLQILPLKTSKWFGTVSTVNVVISV